MNYMRIGVNASFARKPDTGIGQVTINFLKNLAKIREQKVKVKKFDFILYLEEDLPPDLYLPENFSKKVFLPTYQRDDLIRKIWWEKKLLPKKVKEDKCDILISLYQCPTQISEVKHLMIVHDIIPKLFPEYLNNWRKKFYWKQTEKALRTARHLVAVSHRTEKDLVQNLDINPRKISVAHIDVDEIFRKPVSEQKSEKIMQKHGLKAGYIYFGGGLEKRKNAENVLRAYKKLYEKNKVLEYVNPFPKLVISGKLMPKLAPLITDVEKLVKELNLTPQVKILGFVPQEDLPALYKNAIFFFYPSLYEGFGLPLLEALCLGKPVLTSKTSALPEVGSDAALYCRPTDIDDMTQVMKNILINKPLRDRLAERAKERSQHFSWNNFTQKIINLINESRFW